MAPRLSEEWRPATAGVLAAILWLTGGAVFAAAATPEVPVDDRGRSREKVTQNPAQIRAGIAYRELEEARFQAKLADQDFLNAGEAHAVAAKAFEASKRDLDSAQKARDSARERMRAAEKRYEAELDQAGQLRAR